MNTFTAAAKEIGVAALLGTGRQAFALPQIKDGPLGALLAQMKPQPPEACLLHAAAAVLLYRQAGSLPDTEKILLPEPARPEFLPACSQRFTEMLNRTPPDILPEALALLEAAGQRVPHSHLPILLQRGQLRKVRSVLASVIGEHGRWLASQNPQWEYLLQGSLESLLGKEASPSEKDELWQKGVHAVRLTILQGLRRDDPDRARVLVEESWSAEIAKNRTDFVLALEKNLSQGDEPFLEAALDDRSREVRRAALDLLVRLPGSQLLQRMTERAVPLLTFKRPLLGPSVVEASPPPAFDRAWKRDGIEEKIPHNALGDRAGWLAQILGMVPLRVWEERFGKPPSVLVPAAARGEWADAVILGWQQAAGYTGDARWAEALARQWLDEQRGKPQPSAFPPLLSGMPASAFETLALEALETDSTPLHDLHPALTVLQQYDAPWSEKLSRAVGDTIKRRFSQRLDKETRLQQTIYSLQPFALRVPLGMCDELLQDWAMDRLDDHHFFQRGIEEFLNVLRFRDDLFKEIQKR